MDRLFYPASKITWALLRPDTVLIVLLALGIVLLILGWRRAAIASLAAALIGFLVVSIFPVGLLVVAPLERAYPANPDHAQVTGILVLGGGEETDRAAVWDQAAVNTAGDRFFAAILLANRYPEARILLTGRSGRVLAGVERRATVAEAILLSAGISPDRILVENRSRNTAENASFSRDLLGEQSGTWVLVTSAFHMRRSIESFCAAGWTNLVPWPTDFRGGVFWVRIGWDPAGHLQDLNDATKEWIGLIAYRLTGKALPPRGDCLLAAAHPQ